MGASEPQFCLVLRPTQAEFSKPFCDYIQDVCKRNPDIPMFKVVPPKGWSPRKKKFPALDSLRIQTPIKQHVFGTGGAFRCLFVEQRGLSVADFKKLSGSRAHKTPPKGHRQDELLERAFWSSVTINPPFYGADTPTSFFDEQLDFGWNLRNLHDLLKQYDVPPIAGVTTPMVYFGMWKSFFSWHVEDVDLYSINYLHFGAPKVWYCVSPKDRAKFEEMAKSHFPELHNVCPAFLRHKDILLSPKTLRNHHISYVQAKQEAGEFIVLNAGAYHSGFNLGFNCAEAVNFALPEWLPTGRAASHCTCTALPDHVHLDMKMFSRGPRVSQRLKARRDQESDSESELESEEESSSGSEEEEQPPAPQRKKVQASTKKAPGKAEKEAAKARRSGAKAQRRSSSKKETPSAKPTPQKRGPKPASPPSPVEAEDAKQRKNPFASANRSPALAKLAAARGLGSKRLAGQPAEEVAVQPKRRRKASLPEGLQTQRRPSTGDSRPMAGSRKSKASAQPGKEPSPHPVRRAMDEALVWMRTLVTGQQAAQDLEDSSGDVAPEPTDDAPCAIVGEDESSQKKYFFLVQRLQRHSRRKGSVLVRWLKEEEDGIFRPSEEIWEEAESALVPVRTQPWKESLESPAGFRLLTLRYRILDTELVD